MTDKTDWNLFYQQRGAVSRITSGLAFRSFFSCLRPFLAVTENGVCGVPLNLTEFGGGNSVFYDKLVCAFPGSRLTLVDLCETTPAFAACISANPLVHDMKANLLAPEAQSPLATLRESSDIAFSFGLIEHFSVAETREVIARHFAVTRPGGLVYLSFPTPVLLYRLMRRSLELCNRWPFHDERPLKFEEVRAAAAEYGTELAHGVCIRLGLVQGYVLYRKHGAAQ